jgi:ATP-dependent RNA helicase DeaD
MHQTLSDALAARGYDTLTSVQEAVTAPDLAGADLLVSAQTGSGKTVGFGLAIAPTLLDEAGSLGPAAAPLALIVAPTRELALQVMREIGWLYAGAGARVVSCVGGMDMRDERRALERGAHVVVGTPGRLRDHIQRGSLEMDALRAVVLDEADEMLDLGFREDLEFMLAAAPEDRRTLLFSATVPPAIAGLAKQYQRDAVRVSTQSGTRQHADIAYQALQVAQTDAENAIINVLRYHDAANAIVFANTRATVNRLTARFANRGFAVVSLSGELSQSERTHALQAMRDGRARVCVATDVAARGIDLPNLELVVHADLPKNTEGLLHRSGRTGRAGRKGISALIVPPREVKRAQRLLKFAKIEAEWTTAPGAEEILRRDEERLLSDPAWDEPATPEQADFAARLLETRSPEQVAAAYLRLYRSRQTAPEDLSPPDARPAREPRAPFGPSAWVALSVGLAERAEPRWILPLLCRAGDLSKDDIGAIRVQETETFVELRETAVPGLMSRLDAGGALEKGVKVRPAEAPPAGGPRGERPERPDRPERRERPPHQDRREDRRDAPREDKPKYEKPGFDKPRAEKPRPEKPRAEKPRSEKPRAEKPPLGRDEGHMAAKRKERHAADGAKPRPASAEAAPEKRKERHGAGAKPARPRPAPGGEGKPVRAKGPAGGGKPFKGKPAGKPAAKGPRPDARDTSKRFERPGAKPGKPGGKPAGKPGGKGKHARGGDAPPRRGR